MNAWFADRQSGRWAEQSMARGLPNLPRHAPQPSQRLHELAELKQRGAITDAEFDLLRARLRV